MIDLMDAVTRHKIYMLSEQWKVAIDVIYVILRDMGYFDRIEEEHHRQAIRELENKVEELENKVEELEEEVSLINALYNSEFEGC